MFFTYAPYLGKTPKKKRPRRKSVPIPLRAVPLLTPTAHTRPLFFFYDAPVPSPWYQVQNTKNPGVQQQQQYEYVFPPAGTGKILETAFFTLSEFFLASYGFPLVQRQQGTTSRRGHTNSCIICCVLPYCCLFRTGVLILGAIH